jgi:hypothetical protein
MKMRGLLLTIVVISAAQAQAAVRHFVYNSSTLVIDVTMEDPQTTESPRILNFSIKYKPNLGRYIGRQAETLNENNIVDVHYHGWEDLSAEYYTWVGSGSGGHMVKAIEANPLRTVQIVTDSPLINKVQLMFSRKSPRQLPTVNIETNSATSLTMFNPQMQEVEGCEGALAGASPSSAVAHGDLHLAH